MKSIKTNRTNLAIAAVFMFAPHAVLANLQDHFLLTFNMQGSSATTDSKWTSIVKGLAINHDVLTLQEAGPVTSLPSASHHLRNIPLPDNRILQEFIWNAGSNSMPILRWIYFLETDVNGRRVNIATVTSQQHPEHRDIHYIPPQAAANGNSFRSRPSFGVEQVSGGTTTAFFNLHAGSMGPSSTPRNDANNLVAAIRNEMAQNHPSLEWAVSGDFNQHPDHTYYDQAGDEYLFRSFGATQMSGNELDYMVARITQGTVIPWLGHRIAGASDHAAVEFRLGGGQGARVPDIQRNGSGLTGPEAAETVSFLLNYDLEPQCRFKTPGADWSDPDSGQSAFLTGLLNTSVINDYSGAPLLLSQTFDGKMHYAGLTTSNGECEVMAQTTLYSSEPTIYNTHSSVQYEQDTVLLAAAGINGSIDFYYQSLEVSNDFVVADLDLGVTGFRYNPLLMRGTKGNIWIYATDSEQSLFRKNIDASNDHWLSSADADRPLKVVQIESVRRSGENRVFALDNKGVLYHQLQKKDGKFYKWSKKYQNPPTGFSQIKVAVDDGKDLLLMGLGFNKKVYYKWLKSNNRWTSWKIITDQDDEGDDLGAYVGVDVSRTANNKLEILLVTKYGEVVHSVEDSSRNFSTLTDHCGYPRRCLKTMNDPDTSQAETKLEVLAGGNPRYLQVTLVDRDGDPVKDTYVEFAVIMGRARFGTKKGKTDATGKFKSTLLKNGKRTATIVVKYDSNNDDQPDTLIVNGSPLNHTFANGG